jgi:hypothetical protein
VLLNGFSLTYQILGSFKGLKSIDYKGHLLYIQNTIDAWIKIRDHELNSFQWTRAAEELGNQAFVDDKSQSVGVVIHLLNYFLGNTDLGLVNDSRNYLVIYHLVVVIINIIMLVAVFYVMHIITKSHLIALLVVTVINSNPVWFGHMYINPRDTILACGVTLVGLGLISTSINIAHANKILFLGFTISIGTRLSIIPLIAIMTLCWLTYLLMYKDGGVPKKIFRFSLNLLFSLACILLTNPQLWASPLRYTIETFKSASNFNLWGGQIIVGGEYIDGNNPPLRYLIEYFIAQTPILYIFIFALTLILFIYNVKNIKWNKNKLELLTVCIFLIQLLTIPLYLMINHSTVYNGYRQFLFMWPAFVITIIFLLLITEFKNNKYMKMWMNTINIYIFGTLLIQIPMFPYNYIYYNELVSQNNVNYNWEKDYFGASIIEYEYIYRQNFNNIYIYPQNIIYGIDQVTGSKYNYSINSQNYKVILWEDVNFEGRTQNCVDQSPVIKTLYGQKLNLARLLECKGTGIQNSFIQRSYEFKQNDIDGISVKTISRVNKIYGDSLCISFEIINTKNGKNEVNANKFRLVSQKSSIYANRHSLIMDSNSSRGYQLTKILEPNEIALGVSCFDGEKIEWTSETNNVVYGENYVASFNLNTEYSVLEPKVEIS